MNIVGKYLHGNVCVGGGGGGGGRLPFNVHSRLYLLIISDHYRLPSVTTDRPVNSEQASDQ